MTEQTKNRRRQARMCARRRGELIVLVAACLAFGYAFSSCSKPENKVEIAQTEIIPSNAQEISVAPSINPKADFSKFQHSNAEHARFPCALCHERTDNSATPKRTAHLPCAGCHTAQFADNKSAICTICHTGAEFSAAVKPFPVLKSFNVVFDHAKHLRETNCATCHRPTRGGVAFSIPTGLNAHNSCFQCHTPEAKSGERDIASCGACHQPGKFVRVSDQARTFEKTPFSHAAHRLDCTSCHDVKAGARRGSQVSAPVAAMHFAPKKAQSCASCHNNKRAFGGDDFSDCRRCHRGNNFKFS